MAEFLHLSTFLRRPIVDQDGERLGRVQDLVARLGDDSHPPIVGAVVRIEGRDVFVPVRKIGGWSSGRMTFEGKRVDLRRFERRPGEILLAQDLLSRNLINLVRGRLMVAHEIEIAEMNGRWEVVGVGPGRRSFFGGTSRSGGVVDFGSILPFVSHVPSARLRIPYRKLAKLHPAQIADLVEQASHEEGEEIIEAVGLDRELEADVFEELDTEHQLEFLEARSDSEAARLLSRMEPDNAADLITEIDQERRLNVLENLPSEQQSKVRQLLSYNADTAGGLMNTDFVTAPRDASVGDVLDIVRSSSVPAESLYAVFLLGEGEEPVATVALGALVKSRDSERALDLARTPFSHVHPQWDVHRVASTMSDYNLLLVPVLDDDHGRLLGVITVDDLLEELLPQGWRREFGMTSVEE
ncbi:MAG: CBS domain-containing protein [Acidobacteria bacterium]|jgi:CBS domain-containing protein|nr:CBS domain-containing protein [Acidobacteriota bacterium]